MADEEEEIQHDDHQQEEEEWQEEVQETPKKHSKSPSSDFFHEEDSEGSNHNDDDDDDDEDSCHVAVEIEPTASITTTTHKKKPSKKQVGEDPADTPAMMEEDEEEEDEEEVKRQVERHRAAFYADTTAFIPAERDHQRCTQMPDEYWNKCVNILQKWVAKPKTWEEKKFKQGHQKLGHKVINKFALKKVPGPNGQTMVELHRTDTTKNRGSLAVPNSKIFDIIRECHQVEHEKGYPMYLQLKKTYYNITARQCEVYVKLCNACKRKKTKHATLKEEEEEDEKPKHSGQFRDRFDVGFIDMRNHVQTNYHGIVMRWILTCRDDFSGFVWLRAMGNNSAADVAHELTVLFGDVGYPLIIHIDNGQDVTAKSVLDIVKQHLPDIKTVPCNPSNQGTVENIYEGVREILGRMERQERNKGNVPNWTLLIPRVEATMNSLPQSHHKVSASEAVYGKIFRLPCRQVLPDGGDMVNQHLSIESSPGLDAVAEIIEGDEALPDDDATDGKEGEHKFHSICKKLELAKKADDSMEMLAPAEVDSDIDWTPTKKRKREDSLNQLAMEDLDVVDGNKKPAATPDVGRPATSMKQNGKEKKDADPVTIRLTTNTSSLDEQDRNSTSMAKETSVVREDKKETDPGTMRLATSNSSKDEEDRNSTSLAKQITVVRDEKKETDTVTIRLANNTSSQKEEDRKPSSSAKEISVVLKRTNSGVSRLEITF